MTSSSKSATEGGAANADAAPVKRYSLVTAICLIVGICIGSGIFFKSDNILIATDGNVALGVAMMLLAATTIVFGGLTLARFAARTTGHGGLIAYGRNSWARAEPRSSAGTSPFCTCPSSAPCSAGLWACTRA